MVSSLPRVLRDAFRAGNGWLNVERSPAEIGSASHMACFDVFQYENRTTCFSDIECHPATIGCQPKFFLLVLLQCTVESPTVWTKGFHKGGRPVKSPQNSASMRLTKVSDISFLAFLTPGLLTC